MFETLAVKKRETEKKKKIMLAYEAPLNIEPISIKNAKPNSVKVQLLSLLPDEAVGGAAGDKTGKKKKTRSKSRREAAEGKGRRSVGECACECRSVVCGARVVCV